ncbi:Na+-transporting NADH:ubiquinone oxidoreductase subunit F [Desulfacinum hydrothermale DSM 13146]|uniref:Na+-transporting NADH:ubiquinone oxidoreductase subunit F n=1 Tax=Desulfacinum hydrothermale DSM 13146 TaxID=1121390 RepID=A0A1W1XFN1_9BACT|nr:2Fe-2S iron-sulfur cluster binding domain-containing protein [Desulfacinum hydrothermale]SMC22740.1 Na+-transporting NADH:ubiquinone oxidoreductase subunit F [Desulfacinum hydrothermale DSM 13146]
MVQLALGLLAISTLAALLALLLEAAHAVLADYGECRISINEGQKELTVQGGGKLLGTLMDQGIFIPSACGGRGSCGLCKVKVLEGGGPILPTETPYMDEKEIAEQVRLSCQVRVRNDLAIHIPEEFFLIKEYAAVVVGLRPLTPNIKEVHLKLVDPPEITFKPGQFIQFQVPAYPGCPEPIYRAYSIASPAGLKNEIKLVITRVERGLATTYIHTMLKEGDPVRVNGPYGDFYLRHSEREMVLIATGSGLAPLMSILHQMADEKINRRATLYFGVRCKADLFYQEEIQALAERIPGLSYIPVLSAPAPEDAWEGETGYVTDAVARQIEDASNMEAYLCGNPLMINAAVEILVSKGLPEDRIFYDKFA